MTPREMLESGLSTLGLALEEGARERLLDYLELISKWNRTYNLTAIRVPHEMVTHHLLDSLAVVPALPVPQGPATLADIGSGAGLPGIPIALARPQWKVTLVDSSEKKTAFLHQARIELGLGNVEIEQQRVETWRPATRFDLVISRAFAELAEFWRACRHLLVAKGVLAAMKGAYPRDELVRAPVDCLCSVRRLHPPFLEGERHLVLCRAPG